MQELQPKQNHLQNSQERTSKKDVTQCLAVIESSCANFNLPDKELAINVWHGKLKSYPSGAVKKAVYDLVAEHKYAPALAEVIAKVEKISDIAPINDFDNFTVYPDYDEFVEKNNVQFKNFDQEAKTFNWWCNKAGEVIRSKYVNKVKSNCMELKRKWYEENGGSK